MKKILLHILLVVLGFLGPPVIYETGYRLDQLIRKGIPFLANPRDKWDSVLGWEGKEHVFGDPKKPIDILVLGDSFTDGLTVPSEEMWFASVAKAFPDKKLVAYGGLGYGTLQELMILKRYLATEHPRLVILQLCSNDFLNNFRPLEEKSYLQRPPAPRPYIENGLIRIAYPRPFDWVLLPLVSYSRVAYKFNNKWDIKLAKRASDKEIRSVEFDIGEKGFTFDPFRKAVKITSELLKEFKDTAGDARVIFMLVDDYEPNTHAFIAIARAIGVRLYVPTHGEPPNLSQRLPDGAHLNKDGNKFIGDKFVRMAELSTVHIP